MKTYIVSIAVLLGSFTLPGICLAQLQERSFEDIAALQQQEQKKVVVFIHTSWCQYCKAMENTTFKNDGVVDLLNNDYYFIPLDAEEKQDISFAGKTFSYKPTGPDTGIHTLAEALATMNGKVAFPALVIVNPANEIIFQHDGFINARDMVKLLKEAAQVN